MTTMLKSCLLRVAAVGVVFGAIALTARADDDGATTQPAPAQPTTSEPASTQPEAARATRGDVVGGPQRAAMRNRMRQNADRSTPSDADWDKIVAFMQQHSPRRLTEFQDMPAAQPGRKVLLKQLIAARFDYVMGLKQSDPKLFDLQIGKMECEDSIFGMLRDHPHDSMSDGDQQQFKMMVTKLVGINFDERQQRIDSAVDSLEKARTALAHDREQQDKLIEQREADLIKNGARPLKLQNPDGGDRPDKGGKPTGGGGD